MDSVGLGWKMGKAGLRRSAGSLLWSLGWPQGAGHPKRAWPCSDLRGWLCKRRTDDGRALRAGPVPITPRGVVTLCKGLRALEFLQPSPSLSVLEHIIPHHT